MSFWSAADDKKYTHGKFSELSEPKISLHLLNLKRYQNSEIHFNCGYPFGRKCSLFKIAKIKFFNKICVPNLAFGKSFLVTLNFLNIFKIKVNASVF